MNPFFENINQIHDLIIFWRPDYDSWEFRSLGWDIFSVKVGSYLENLHFTTHKLGPKRPKNFFSEKIIFFLIIGVAIPFLTAGHFPHG